MQNPLVTGILSYGMSGRLFHAPFIETNPKFKLHAVTERTEKEAYKRYPDIISYDSVEELLEDSLIELVIVNTPNFTHFDFAKLALKAGKHVLVEKPFSATTAEAKELFNLAKMQGKHIMAYQNRRWDTDFQSLKSVIESGELGQLMEVHFRFDRYRREISIKGFKENPLPASGLSFDLGPHLLDQVISLFGKPIRSFKTLGAFRPDSKVDDFMHVHLIYPGNLSVYITANLLVASPLPAFVIHGTKGSFIKSRTDVQEAQLDQAISPLDEDYGIEPDGSEGMLVTINDSGVKETEYVKALKGNYSHLFDAVYDQIRNDVSFPVTEEEIIWQLEILESESIKI